MSLNKDFNTKKSELEKKFKTKCKVDKYILYFKCNKLLIMTSQKLVAQRACQA